MKFKNIVGKGNGVNIKTLESDFVSLASHQLRTPLSAIKWYTEMMLKDKSATLSRKQRDYLEEIQRANERAINLVNDLLDVSRIQEGEIHLEFRLTEVEKVVREIIDGLTTLIRSSKVGVSFELVGEPLPTLETDPDKLKRVISNLVSNAVKYTPVGGTVRIVVENKTDYVLISVTDSGAGIPKTEQEQVFQKFFRSPNAVKLVPEGTGLGLFISKFLIEAMGGKIGFRSVEGKGTTFYFTLPMKG